MYFFGWYIDAELTNRYFFDYPLTEDTTLYAKFYDTTLGEYIVLSNVEQLMAVKDAPDAKYLLACDINCKGKTLVPIDEFTGELEGNGYKIHNYMINEEDSVVGFVRINNGIIKNTSFSDFAFIAVKNDGANKNYGVVCAVNNGTIENCTVKDGEIKVNCKKGTPDPTLFVGGIAGNNTGSIKNCTNYVCINVDTYTWGVSSDGGHVFMQVGGIVGHNEKNAFIVNCTNHGNTDISCTTERFGYSFVRIGGIVGENLGEIEVCLNHGSLGFTGIENFGSYTQGIVLIGGAVGYNNTGSVVNCYSDGSVIVNNSGNDYQDCIGGFVGNNKGSIYNCYSVSNIEFATANMHSIGGFAGLNEALINKCFTGGKVALKGLPANTGCFVGQTTGIEGIEMDCAYLDTMTITNTTVVDEVETTETVEPTNTIGNAMAEKDLLSVDFLENTLYFDRMVWFLVEGKLPALR